MKLKLLLNFFILFAGFSINLMAQQADEYRHITDSLLQHLDKSGVTIGVLYDRVFPLAALNNFNLAQPDTSSKWHFIQAYSEFYRSAYTPNPNWWNMNDLELNLFRVSRQGNDIIHYSVRYLF